MTTVFRVEKNREYVVMNHKFLRNKEMSLKSKGLLALCLALPETWNYSISGLCAICKESQTSIRSALKELEEHKHLRRIRTKDEKGQFHYEYILYEVPYEEPEKPYAENVHTDNQQEEKQYKENRIQESNVLENNILESNDGVNTEEEKISSLLQNLGNVELIEAYWDYIDLRKEMKAPLTSMALKRLMARAKKLSNNNIKVERVLLENALINGWKNVFPLKEADLEYVSNDMKSEMRDLFGLD